jgi:hypothetical protein
MSFFCIVGKMMFSSKYLKIKKQDNQFTEKDATNLNTDNTNIT